MTAFPPCDERRERQRRQPAEEVAHQPEVRRDDQVVDREPGDEEREVAGAHPALREHVGHEHRERDELEVVEGDDPRRAGRRSEVHDHVGGHEADRSRPDQRAIPEDGLEPEPEDVQREEAEDRADDGPRQREVRDRHDHDRDEHEHDVVPVEDADRRA